MTPRRFHLAFGALLVLGCGDSDATGGGGTGATGGSKTSSAPSSTATDMAGGGGMGQGGDSPFVLTSTAYEEGGTIPTVHECGPPVVADGPGDNASPPLAWTPGPAGTMSYAIVMRDRDFMNLVHWVIYDIPASVSSLPGDVPLDYEPASVPSAKQAEIQGVFHGYLGPCSPNSVNMYEITVHALDFIALPGVDENTPEDTIAPMIESMSLASASLSGES